MIFLINQMSSLIRKSILYRLGFIVLFINLCSCDLYPPQNKNNIWIGQFTNKVYKISNPYLYDYNDSIIISVFNQAQKLSDSSQVFTRDSVLLIERDADTLYFKKAKEVKPINYFHYLTDKNWLIKEKNENESLIKEKIYQFKKDSTVNILTKYKLDNSILYSESEAYNYKIVSRSDVTILAIFNDYFVIQGQITTLEQDKLIVDFVNNILPKTYEFIGYENKSINLDNPFQTCYESSIGQYFYYELGAKYNGGLRKIKEIFAEQYKYSSETKNQDGYIRIRFVVNCEGQIGRFSIMETDDNYQPYLFDREIVKNLFFIITKYLKDWTPGVVDKDNSTQFDYYKHLTFKIKEGKLIDILP
ncbi:hypothetical protein [Moheibacter lacus]|uniref:Uncharacterized protein n=1 Tax=Moheibacter lacus TaxID=2745851 RepID=A0A838ZQ91_9FLAO|nr:hypothetical protein [Moheibacter lacus]MBA5629235.1 hypothetical protein [Moheibacter lacus]